MNDTLTRPEPPQTLTLGGEDYVVIPKAEYARLLSGKAYDIQHRLVFWPETAIQAKQDWNAVIHCNEEGNEGSIAFIYDNGGMAISKLTDGLKRMTDVTRRMIEEEDDDEAWAVSALDAYDAEVAAGRGLALPKEDWARIHAGESPVRVIREFRGWTQMQLSEKSGVARPDISAIEAGKKQGSVATVKAIARALGASLDVIVGD